MGLPDSTINNYLAKNDSLPRIDIAAKIAKAIRVPLEWLADDAAEWPPPDAGAKNTPTQLSDRELMLEVGSRWGRAAMGLYDAFDRAQRVDWAGVQKEFRKWRDGEPLPAALKEIECLIREVAALQYLVVIQFDPQQFCGPLMEQTKSEFTHNLDAKKRAFLDASKACPDLPRLKLAQLFFDASVAAWLDEGIDSRTLKKP